MSKEIILPLRPELLGESPYGAPQLEVPVRLNVNENPYPLSPTVITDITQRVAKASAELNRYPDRDFLQLRTDLADYLAYESRVVLSPENIWAANGSNEVMLQILQAFAGSGRKVGSFIPTYSMYAEYVRTTGSRWITGNRTTDFSLDFCEVERVLAENPAVLLLASPNNPTGNALDFVELKRILALSVNSGPMVITATGEKHPSSTIVVVDEAYAEFRRVGTPSALELLAEYPNLIVTRTMSKAFGSAGLRLGYMAASKAIIEQIMLVRLPYHLSAITQAAACGALANREILLAQVAQIRKDRDELVGQLRALGLETAPTDANFVFFGKLDDPHKVWQELLERGILIREVGVTGWLRVSIGTDKENKQFLQALTEVLK